MAGIVYQEYFRSTGTPCLKSSSDTGIARHHTFPWLGIWPYTALYAAVRSAGIEAPSSNFVIAFKNDVRIATPALSGVVAYITIIELGLTVVVISKVFGSVNGSIV